MTLYIFGAGGGALELLESLYDLKQSPDVFNDAKLVVDKATNQTFLVQYHIKEKFFVRNFDIISLDNCKQKFDKTFDKLFISAIDVKFKNRIASQFPKENFITFEHKNTEVLAVNKGYGNWYCYGCHVPSDINIGSHVRINYNAAVGHTCSIGDCSFIGINSSVCAGTNIGKGVLVNSGAVIINKNITVGDNSVIGAGAVVTKDVPAGAVVFGIPAKENAVVKAGAKK